MKVSLVSITNPSVEGLENAEHLMVYAARVSNKKNQLNTNSSAKLLKYCIDHGHWSVFEQASFAVEIETSRAISAQILRHKSFNHQEFSQRYSNVTNFEIYEARGQDVKNRQNSLDNMDESTKEWFINAQECVKRYTSTLYNEALKKGIAKEQARFLLPMSSSTRIYMSGTVRSWIHYCALRCEKATQKEHREIANAIWKIFRENFPATAKAVEEKYEYLQHIN